MTQDAVTDRQLLAAGILQHAPTLVAQGLAQQISHPAALKRLVNLARQSGLLEEAALLNQRLLDVNPADESALILKAIFSRRPRPPTDLGSGVPSPFVRITDFMSASHYAVVLDAVIAALPRFSDGQVLREDTGVVDLSFRRTAVLNDAKEFSGLVLQPIKHALETCNISAVLGVSLGANLHFELQASCYSDNSFFRTHVDNTHGGARSRLVSFVFYLHTEPRQFDGGDLLLIDAATTTADSSAYTRIQPTKNSIVFFRSDALHEVEPVRLHTQSAKDSRLSINGWIHAKSNHPG